MAINFKTAHPANRPLIILHSQDSLLDTGKLWLNGQEWSVDDEKTAVYCFRPRFPLQLRLQRQPAPPAIVHHIPWSVKPLQLGHHCIAYSCTVLNEIHAHPANNCFNFCSFIHEIPTTTRTATVTHIALPLSDCQLLGALYQSSKQRSPPPPLPLPAVGT